MGLKPLSSDLLWSGLAPEISEPVYVRARVRVKMRTFLWTTLAIFDLHGAFEINFYGAYT